MDSYLSKQQSSPRSYRPYMGWALEKAIEFDAVTPSVLAESFRWGALRRQVMFLIFSQISTEFDLPGFAARCVGDNTVSLIEPVDRIGSALLTQRPQQLLRTLLGIVPHGLIGTLRRLGYEPAERSDCYKTLLGVFGSQDRTDRLRVRLLGQSSGPLRPGQIDAVAVLDPVLIHPNMLARTKSIVEAQTLNHALAYVRARCSTATDQALRQSLDRISDERKLTMWLRRWVERFDRLPDCTSPFSADPTLYILNSGAALIDAGRRYGNCLRSKVAEVVTGRFIYIEHKPDYDQPGAIVELRYTSRGYILEGIYAKSNGMFPQDRAAALRTRLSACGVAIRCHVPGEECQLAATAKLLGMYDWRGHGSDMGWGHDLETEFGE